MLPEIKEYYGSSIMKFDLETKTYGDSSLEEILSENEDEKRSKNNQSKISSEEEIP